MTITRTAAVILTLVAVGTALAGCSSGSSGTPPAAQSVSTVVVTETSGSTTATPTPATSSTPSGTDRCRAAQLDGSLSPAPGGASAGSMHYELTLTNTGSAACTTGGFPGVSFVGDGNGTQLGAPARRDDTAASSLRIAPGRSATADLAVAQAANFPDCSPQTADGLRVFPPDDRDSLFVRTTGLTTCRSDAVLLTVGPLR